jgi:cytosolic carboxypeptidase protein 2/3
VHPGESNSSYMMQGFIRAILGQSLQAKELRKRCVFKIIPMVNPDGVIVGNYRTNIAGNDLNRKYHDPDQRLHPTVCAIKKIVHNICFPDGEEEEGVVPEEDKVFAFIDMHGHSRKKNVFVYGPYYPLHNDKYLRMRVLPKLISEETSKFRFFSCKFRIERSKEKAARIVLWREFNIMNCFTFEASFYGALNDDRQTEEFSISTLEKMGEHLCNAFYEYMLIIEEEERLKKIKELSKKKKQAS